MNCLVSAAMLVNCLQDTLGDNFKTSDVWDAAQLDQAFTTLAGTRYEKVTAAVESTEKAMSMLGWGSTFDKILYKVLLPTLPVSAHCNDATKVIKGGEALKGWRLPEVPHTVLYDDEERLRSKETGPSTLSPAALIFAITAAAIGCIAAARTMHKQPEILVNGWKTLQSLTA
jgi:hypothetical protein